MIRIIFTLLSLLICTTSGCISDKEPEGPSLTVGDSLPDFSVEMNDGTRIASRELKGKISVIVFFNTSCSDCQKELPVIQQLWDIYKSTENVIIMPIAREESQSEIEAYWKAQSLSMPYSPQENRDVYSLFARSVIPRIYIADTLGVITAAFGDIEMPDLQSLIVEIDKLGQEDPLK